MQENIEKYTGFSRFPLKTQTGKLNSFKLGQTGKWVWVPLMYWFCWDVSNKILFCSLTIFNYWSSGYKSQNVCTRCLNKTLRCVELCSYAHWMVHTIFNCLHGRPQPSLCDLVRGIFPVKLQRSQSKCWRTVSRPVLKHVCVNLLKIKGFTTPALKTLILCPDGGDMLMWWHKTIFTAQIFIFYFCNIKALQ